MAKPDALAPAASTTPAASWPSSIGTGRDPVAVDHRQIRVTQPRGLDADQQLVGARAARVRVRRWSGASTRRSGGVRRCGRGRLRGSSRPPACPALTDFDHEHRRAIADQRRLPGALAGADALDRQRHVRPPQQRGVLRAVRHRDQRLDQHQHRRRPGHRTVAGRGRRVRLPLLRRTGVSRPTGGRSRGDPARHQQRHLPARGLRPGRRRRIPPSLLPRSVTGYTSTWTASRGGPCRSRRPFGRCSRVPRADRRSRTGGER